MKLVFRFLATCLLVAGLAALSGCVGATRMVKRERGPSGEQLDKSTLDLAFVQPGTTTRNEVLSRLSMIDTGYDHPHLFWGRWAASNWGYWWMVVAPATNGGGGASAGDAHRVWNIHNVLITFDDQGKVQYKLLVDDDSTLWRELRQHADTLPPITAPELTLYSEERSPLRIHLRSDRVEVVREGKKKARTAQVSPEKIFRITNSGPGDKRNRPGETCHTLYLSEKTAFGKKLDFCTKGATLIATFQYLHSYGSRNMAWE